MDVRGRQPNAAGPVTSGVSYESGGGGKGWRASRAVGSRKHRAGRRRAFERVFVTRGSRTGGRTADDRAAEAAQPVAEGAVLGADRRAWTLDLRRGVPDKQARLAAREVGVGPGV